MSTDTVVTYLPCLLHAPFSMFRMFQPKISVPHSLATRSTFLEWALHSCVPPANSSSPSGLCPALVWWLKKIPTDRLCTWSYLTSESCMVGARGLLRLPLILVHWIRPITVCIEAPARWIWNPLGVKLYYYIADDWDFRGSNCSCCGILCGARSVRRNVQCGGLGVREFYIRRFHNFLRRL